MSAPDMPRDARVTYRQQYRHCGKATCARCAPNGPGHGPYWYAFWWEDGRSHSRYLGKQAPSGVAVAGVSPGSDGYALHAAPLPPLRVQVLGGFAVWRGEEVIPPTAWASHRASTLFKCLLAAPGYRLRREEAGELLWPDGEPIAGAVNLRTTIYRLRQALDGAASPTSYLRTEGDALILAPGGDGPPDDDWLDAAAFARAARAALAGHDAVLCRAALGRYTGDYLPDEPYADWADAPRETLRRQYLDLLLHLAALSGTQGDLAQAEECLRRALAAEPGHEAAAATLMALLAESGRRDEALRVYQALSTALEKELDATPGAEVATLRAQIVAQEAAPAATRMPPQRALPARLTNLPVAMTSFVGRAWEVAAVGDALAQARLVTLTGPGGCGKTRLALAVAETLVERYVDGVWLAELAALAGPAMVSRAILTALGMTEQPDQSPLDTLIDFLRSRHVLLVLDNCEHLIGACAELAAALLQTCPHLRVLATSREELAVAGERPYLVPSLTVPNPAALPPLEQLETYEAVQLFLQRARLRRPDLSLTAANAAAIAQVCAWLDGLPLAIELAAARVGVVPVDTIAARLDDRFLLLTGGPRSALPRQQTLRAAIDWSYALLSAAEQALLRRLAVFTGGWTLEAAEAVCSGEEIEGWAVLDLLTGLIHKSLARLEEAAPAGEQGRYRLLETVRQYGWEQLSANGDEAARVRDRHLTYALALAEQAAPRLNGPEQGDWLARLEREHDNLRAALGWAGTSGDGERGLRLAVALCGFWDAHGHVREGRAWLERLLACEGGGDGGTVAYTRAKALNGAGWLALQQGEYDQAIALCEEGLALERGMGDKAGMALSLLNLGVVALDRGNHERAIALNEESLMLARELGDTWGIAASLANLGTVAMEQGNYERAAPLLEESMVVLQERGDTGGVALVLHNLAYMERARDRHGRAATLYVESLALFHALDNRPGIARCLDGLASVACAQHEPRRAARLAGAAAALRESLGTSLPPVDRDIAERDMAAARALLGDDAFTMAWAAGMALPLEQAMAEALSVAD